MTYIHGTSNHVEFMAMVNSLYASLYHFLSVYNIPRRPVTSSQIYEWIMAKLIENGSGHLGEAEKDSDEILVEQFHKTITEKHKTCILGALACVEVLGCANNTIYGLKRRAISHKKTSQAQLYRISNPRYR